MQERLMEGRKSKENRDDKMKTKLAGSWYGSTNSLGDFRKKSGKGQRSECSNLAEGISPKIDPTQSFSRFLSKGVLVVRD